MKVQCEKLLIIILGLVPWLISCQKSEVDVADEMFDLPISFALQEVGAISTKALSFPDGEHPMQPGEAVRPVFVDKVRVNIYYRLKDGTYKNNIEGFAFLKSQELQAYMDNETGFYTAKGTISLRKDYEYRVTAMGYNSEKQEDGLFRFGLVEGNPFSDSYIELTEAVNYKTPELFFGTPVSSVQQDTIFRYREDDKSRESLTGWLFRGVAGVEISLNNVPATVSKIELLAISLNTKSKARWYNDFKTPYELMTSQDKYGGFVLNSWERPATAGNEGGAAVETISLVGGNLLSVKSALAIRVIDAGSVFYKLLRVREVRQPKEENITRVAPPDGGDGTGIITPEEGDGDPDKPVDPGLSEYEIPFLRNHYYRITADYQRLSNLQYITTVVVNPEWDADISLSLGDAIKNNVTP